MSERFRSAWDKCSRVHDVKLKDLGILSSGLVSGKSYPALNSLSSYLEEYKEVRKHARLALMRETLLFFLGLVIVVGAMVVLPLLISDMLLIISMILLGIFSLFFLFHTLTSLLGYVMETRYIKEQGISAHVYKTTKCSLSCIPLLFSSEWLIKIYVPEDIDRDVLYDTFNAHEEFYLVVCGEDEIILLPAVYLSYSRDMRVRGFNMAPPLVVQRKDGAED